MTGTVDTIRCSSVGPPWIAGGWALERLTPPSRLYGANGIRNGPDGRLYIAQCLGSKISALDVDSGELETISAMGSEIVGPDDLAFDDRGDLYVTEPMEGRISVRTADGRTTVLRADLPGVNGITFHQGRLFVDECRLGGRLLELDLQGGEPRAVLEDLELPNALAAGPDGLLYFPLVAASEIWRVHPATGAAERVVSGLRHPVALKFDGDGFIVSPQSGSGEILRIDPHTGARTVLARLDPGLDNLAFIGDRLFVSHLTNGRITEILRNGDTREVLPPGLQYPLDIAVGDTGKVYASDMSSLNAVDGNGAVEPLGWIFAEGFPGSVRGIAIAADGFYATTTSGQVVSYRPDLRTHDVLADGFDELYGIDTARDGVVAFADRGSGRVLSLEAGKTTLLASGLCDPMGVVLAPDGGCYISEAGAGRVVVARGGRTATVLDGLQNPHGIALAGDRLYVVDAGMRTLDEFDLSSRTFRTIAANLPVGMPPGVTPKPLRGMPPLSGPLRPFTGLAAGSDGTIYFSADAEGSVIALRRTN